MIMRRIFVLSFTARGSKLAQELAQGLTGKLAAIGEGDVTAERVSAANGIHEYIKPIFEQGSLIIFVGAAGIAVRAVAPFIRCKTTDPAVIVIDEHGRFVIPILSGHIGGANKYAKMLAGLLNATAVITTATDINKVFSVDTFAMENGYAIRNKEAVKTVSAALLDGQEVGLCTELRIDGELPKGLKISSCGSVGIAIEAGVKTKLFDTPPFDTTLYLMPKRFHVGVGARRGISAEVFETLLLKSLEDNNITVDTVAAISSIDLKKNEAAIIRFCKKYQTRFVTYSAKELSRFSHLFAQSEFVKATTGVGNVCETASYISSGEGEIIMQKKSCDGVTIAIAKEAWRVSFEAFNDRIGL